MPLLDHFHPPLAPRRHWESFHVNWAGAMADALNDRLLPEGYFAEEHAQLGARAATLPAQVWEPPAPTMVVPAAFPDSFEVLVFQGEGGATLVAAIELISPANKDRPAHRQAFAINCASYLCQGISLMIVDIVTSRQANLHNEMMRLLGNGDAFALPDKVVLYAVAYRPLVRDQTEQIEVWPATLALGQTLPVLPLALDAELCLPLDLEATYTAACQRRRLG
jgi:hypothetical protein